MKIVNNNLRGKIALITANLYSKTTLSVELPLKGHRQKFLFNQRRKKK